jgi:hypothetical protein
MPTSYKVLGQSYPTASTLTTLYTVPSATQAVVSTITVCNLSNTSDTIRIAIRVGGSSISNEEYIFYNEPIAPTSTMSATLGITLAATDVISVWSTNGVSSFNAFGTEIS